MTHTPDIKVPWGTTSNLGILGSLSGVLVVLLTVIFKMDNDDAIAVAGAILTLGSFGLTLWGRYAQAKQIARTAPLLIDDERCAKPASLFIDERWNGDELAATAPSLAPLQGAGPDRADLEKVEAELERMQKDAP